MLEDLGFAAPLEVLDRPSITDLFRPSARCGIYVLHFSNGEFYAGQAVDVTKRYLQHRKKHRDIASISFKAVAREHLNDEERRVIWRLEEHGWLLRNITFTSIPKGESSFDRIMEPDVQERWLRDITFVDAAGPRADNPDLRRKYRRAYADFQASPHADAVTTVLRAYVQSAIPAFQRSEMFFWGCSCMPAQTVYTRVNIYWQETCAAFLWNNKLWFSMYLARSALPWGFSNWFVRLWHRAGSARSVNVRHAPGGQDQIRFDLPAAAAIPFIRHPRVLPALRLFNLRLMRKGICVYGRNHCFDLADQLVEGDFPVGSKQPSLTAP
jgi:hypothetical protein